MLVAGDFDNNLVNHLVHRGVEPCSLMGNIPHGSAGREDDLSERGQSPWAIGDSRRKAHKSSISGEASLNNSPEHGDVDVSTTERNHNLLSFHLGNVQRSSWKESSKACCSSSLNHSSFMLQEPQNSKGNQLLIDQDSLVDEVPGDSERMGPNSRDSKTVCESVCDGNRGWLSNFQCFGVRSCLLWLDTDDLNFWPQRLDGHGDAGNESRPPDRHNNHIYIRNLFKDLKPDSSCPSTDRRIVEAIDVLHSPELLAVQRVVLSLADVHAVENYSRTQLLASLDLRERSDRWHDDSHRNSHQSSMIGQGKSMISCTGCDDSFSLLLICELFQSVSCSSLLETPCELFVFMFEPEISSSDLAQGVILCSRSVIHMSSNLIGSF
mmetsp:Transcript_8877/g.29665  ORF Transcript_8877/g.29665 Transcript_8877/m.29665 type:complete len:380 (-) Transcript_8877:375-1514(-)